MGDSPEWYQLLVAARYLGVPPWDLLEQPVFWRDWARMAANAEAEAKRQQNESRARKGRR